MPVMVTQNGATSAANTENDQNLPEVKVIPPTPPASQTLKSSTEEAQPIPLSANVSAPVTAAA